MTDAVIVSAVRTAVGKGRRGTLRNARPDDLAACVIREAVRRTPGLQPASVEDVLIGCAFPEKEQGMNVARIASLIAGLPVEVPAATVNRFCSSGLQTIAMAADRIRGGGAEVVVAGGTESMSRVEMMGRSNANPALAGSWPDVYLGMGLTAENLARRYAITREESDRFALESTRKAVAAIDAGRFKDEIVAFEAERRRPGKGGKVEVQKVRFEVDECPRRDTSLEGLGKLDPAFLKGGTVTAGNSSQVSDGAAAVVVMSEGRARAMGLKPLGVMRSFAVAGVPPEVMGIGPVKAVPRALEQAGISLAQVDLIELNEAFAVQALAVARDLALPLDKLNVNGGAVALGHPLGATGTKLTVSVLNELARRGGRYALVTMCIGGGMGAAAVFERQR